MNINLNVIKTLIFEDYPVLSISSSDDGDLFLDYLLQYTDDKKERHLLQRISREEVQLFERSDEPIIQFFRNENTKYCGERIIGTNIVHIIDESVKIQEYEKYFVFDEFVNYPDGYIQTVNTDRSILGLSKEKERVILNVYTKESHGKPEVAVGVLSEIFIPIIELIKRELKLDKRTENTVLKLADFYSNSLGGKVEVEIKKGMLSTESNEYLRIKRIIDLLNASSDEELNALSVVLDESYIEYYKQILNYVIKNRLGVYTSLVDPQSIKPISARLFYSKAMKIKKLIDMHVSATEQVDEVEAIWGEVNVLSQKTHFTIKEIGSEALISGVCSDEVAKKLKTSGALFGNDERVYIFKLKIMHYPATTSRKEKMTYTMMDYNISKNQRFDNSEQSTMSLGG